MTYDTLKRSTYDNAHCQVHDVSFESKRLELIYKLPDKSFFLLFHNGYDLSFFVPSHALMAILSHILTIFNSFSTKSYGFTSFCTYMLIHCKCFVNKHEKVLHFPKWCAIMIKLFE